MSNLVIIDMIRNEKTGKLEFVNSKDQELVKSKTEEMRHNDKVRVIFDFTKVDARISQISKVHAIIGDIAKETGDEFGSVKREVKERAGLFKTGTETLKSFTECSSEDLSEAIKAAAGIAKFLGMSIQ